MADYRLTLCTDVIAPNCNYTYVQDSQQHSSFIDYFLVSEKIVINLKQFHIAEELVNLSDHLPICMSALLLVDADVEPEAGNRPRPTVNFNVRDKVRLRWDHANLANYYHLCNERAQPLLCEIDKFYSNYLDPEFNGHNAYSSHYSDVDSLLNNVSRSAAIKLIESAYATLTATLRETADLTIPTMGRRTLK
jgi:hypothetical protein